MRAHQPRDARLAEDRPRLRDGRRRVEAAGLDPVAEAGEAPGRLGDAVGDLGIDRGRPEGRDVEDPHRALRHGFAPERAEAVRRDGIRVGRPEDPHRRREILDGARHRPDHLEVEHDRRQPAFPRHPAGGGFQADEAGMGSGAADRAARVGPERQGADPGGHGRDGAAAGAPGRQRRIPRVPGDPVDRVAGVALDGQLRDVGLAQDHRPGRAQPRHRRLVPVDRARGPLPREEPAAPAGREPGDVQAVLDGQRHAVEGPERPSRPPARRARGGGALRALGIDGDEGVERGVHGLGPLQAGAGGRDRARRPGGVAAPQGRGREGPERARRVDPGHDSSSRCAIQRASGPVRPVAGFAGGRAKRPALGGRVPSRTRACA